MKIKVYIIVWKGLKEWGLQRFPKPKHSNGPIICHCSHFISSSSPAVIHKSLLSPLRNAAPQASFARMPWLRSWFYHPLAFLQTLFWRNGTREEPVIRDETTMLISSFVSLFFCWPKLIIFSDAKEEKPPIAEERKNSVFPLKHPEGKTPEVVSFGQDNILFLLYTHLCFVTVLSLLFSWRVLASKYDLLCVILFETTFIHQTKCKHDAAFSTLSCW